nr:hypothetical protein [Candidatus Sigynarchaeota archaeon]
MARHLWREDIEQRIAIRTLKDTTPGITTKVLRDKFGVSTNIISAALDKTVDEWKAFAVATPYRARVREPPVLMQEAVQVLGKVEAPITEEIPAPASIPLPEKAGEWEYRAVIVRGRQSFNDIVYEQQEWDQGDWKPLAAKSFQDVLNGYGKEKWELAGMAVLSHGAAGFTGMYELAFKRSRLIE